MIPAQVAMTVTYSFSCAVPGCKEHAASLWELSAGTEPPWPCVPEGWRAVQGIPICPNHHVRIDSAIDGREALFMAETDSHLREAEKE